MRSFSFSLLLLVGCMLASTTVSADEFFRRFSRDRAKLNSEIADVRQQLEIARHDSDPAKTLHYSRPWLGRLLTIARRESEARELLLPAVKEARKIGAHNILGWLLLEKATTEQYLRIDQSILGDFSEAIQVGERTGDTDLQHYALHHRGRYLVEQKAYDIALADFRRALQIRESLGNKSAANSTRAAIAELESMQNHRKP